MSNGRNETKSMALFCDFENVALGVKDAKYQQFDISKVLERLLLKGSIVVKKAYCDWERYREFKAAMHQASFELIEIPHVRQSGKNSADIRMVVDALDLCYTKSHVDTFVIISGDSDFSPLVSKLRENNKTVIGIGVKNSTSDLLIANCDEFIYYDDLVRGQPARRTSRGRDRPPAQPRGAAKPEPAKPEPVIGPVEVVSTRAVSSSSARDEPVAASAEPVSPRQRRPSRARGAASGVEPVAPAGGAGGALESIDAVGAVGQVEPVSPVDPVGAVEAVGAVELAERPKTRRGGRKSAAALVMAPVVGERGGDEPVARVPESEAWTAEAFALAESRAEEVAGQCDDGPGQRDDASGPRDDASTPRDDASGHREDSSSQRDRALDALDMVVGTIEALAAERGEEEKIWGSMVKQTLKRQRPGFNEAYYGYRSFNRLLEEARDRGMIELELDEKSGGYTVRSLA